MKRKNRVALSAVGGACAVVGVAVWAYQIVEGIGVSGITQNYIWGLYIAAFYIAAAAGAACLLVAGLRWLVDKAVDQRLFAASIAAHLSAGLLIGIDTGSIGNIFALVTNPKFSSSIVQDFWCLTCGFVLAIVGLVLVRKRASLPRAFAVVLVGIPALLMIIEGSMLSAMPAHPFWGTGTIASFVFAMLCVASCVALMAGFHVSVARWVLVAVALVALLISAFDVFGNLALGLDVSAYFAGEMGAAFAFYVVAGVIAPVAMVIASRDPRVLAVASALVVVGLVAEKLWMLNAGFAAPILMLSAYAEPSITLVEVLGTVGLAGASLLFFALCAGTDAALPSDATLGKSVAAPGARTEA